MKQIWQIINIDRHERIELRSVELGFNSSWGKVFQTLLIPPLSAKTDEWLSRGREAPQTCRLVSLPTDILNLILDELGGHLLDLSAFAVTCKASLILAKPHLAKALKSEYALWAGTRIICLGHYTYRDQDLPAGLLTRKEKKEINSILKSKSKMVEWEDSVIECYSLFAAAQTYECYYERNNIWTGPEDSSRHWIPESPVDKRDFAMFSQLAKPSRENAKAHAWGELVLFNLSKGECVRAGALHALDTHMDIDEDEEAYTCPCQCIDKFPDPASCAQISLMHALLARICWSGSAPANNAMTLDEVQHLELGRGKWAGDRFCVATLADMPRTPAGREWVDVSEETAEFVYHLWRHSARGDPLCDALTEDSGAHDDDEVDEERS